MKFIHNVLPAIGIFTIGYLTATLLSNQGQQSTIANAGTESYQNQFEQTATSKIVAGEHNINSELTTRLQMRIIALEQQLVAYNTGSNDLSEMFDSKDAALQSLNNNELSSSDLNNDALDSDEQSTNESQVPLITQEEAETLLPYPFATLLTGGSPQTVEYARQHHDQKTDLHWAPEMENQIIEYFNQHAFNQDIQLQSVECRTSSCEVTGFADNNKGWRVAFHDMEDQSWYDFEYSAASANDSSNEGIYFYIVAQK